MKHQKLICCIWSLLILALCLSICQTSLADVLRIPEGTKVIEEEAFYGDTSLDEVLLPIGIKTIGKKAFAEASTRNIFLPESLTSIADDAFEGHHEELLARVYADSYAFQFCLDHSIPYSLIGMDDQIVSSETLFSEICGIVADYKDSNNYIPADYYFDAINAVGEYVKEQYYSGSILDYSITNHGIAYVDAEHSVLHAWTPRVCGESSGGADCKLSILTFAPFASNLTFTNLPLSRKAITYVRDSVDLVKNASDYFEQLDEYTDGEVVLSTIQNIGNNQLVVWNGHGGSAYGVPYLLTGIPYDGSTYGELAGVYKTSQGVVINEYLEGIEPETNDSRLAITHKYIRNHCKSMQNSFIFLGACECGINKQLAQAFLDKGASAVVAFTDTVATEYNVSLLKAVMTNMVSINQTTGKHYTLGEALEKAKYTDGIGASSKGTHKGTDGKKTEYNARPEIFYTYSDFGGPNYSLWFGTVSGYVYEKAESEKRTPARNVEVQLINDRYPLITAEALTDDQGYFEIRVPGGNYHVKLSGEQYITTVIEESIEVQADAKVDEIWYISKAGILKGTVSTKEGKPIEGAKISTQFDSTFSDENGHYEIVMHLTETKVTVSADKFDSEEFTIVVPIDETVIKDVILKPTKGRVAGYVKENNISGPGIEGATITAADSEGNAVTLLADNSWTTTTSDGYYMVQLDPGLYTLTATKDGFSSSVTVEVKSDEIISQDIILQRNCKILFDGNGGTVSNETITVVKGDPIGELPTASNGDKRLKEWNTEPDGNGVAITSAYIPDDDMTVYAIWNERGTAYEGSVFQCLSNNYVQGVTVELHRGAKQVEYYNERIAGGCASGETEITERELAPYESEIIDSCVTDSNGHYTLYLPFDGEPNYTSYNVSFYAYTLVFRKDGWITKYVSSAFRNEDEVASRSPYIYALAPEGEGIRYEVTIPSVGTQSSIIHPYSSYEFNYLGNMYSATYDITRVNLYLNGAYKVGYSAPSYVSQTNWRLGFYSDGYFYLVNKTYKDTYPTGSYLYPSWVNK